MKRQNIMALIVTFICLVTFCTTALAKIKRPVIERGMTKEQVTAALGDPITASFNEFGDRWMYEGWRGPFFGGSNVRVYVMFDVAGKVVGYEERTCEPTQKEETSSQVCQNAVPSITQPMYPNGKCCLSDRGFSTLYNKISNSSFGDEKKDLIEVASLGCYFSCSQCAQILGLFSFDDDKYSVLEFMAPRIIDLQNVNLIYSQFTFDDAKKKAADLLLRATATR